MANCPTCGTPDAYNSGFTLECVNPNCRYFSKTHQKAMGGGDYVETATGVRVTQPESIEWLKLSSPTTSVYVELCLKREDKGISFLRLKSEAGDAFMYPIIGRPFNASVLASDRRGPHTVQVTLVRPDDSLLYDRAVMLNKDTVEFIIGADLE